MNAWQKQYYQKNRERIRAYQKAWYIKNRDRVLRGKLKIPKNVLRHRSYKRLYGISLDEYNQMLVEQGGVCKTCFRKPTRTYLTIDHCHQTGKIRGLLCDQCNSAIGFLQESSEIVQRVLDYLRA